MSLELSKRHQVFVFFRVCDLELKEYAVVRKNIAGLEAFAVNNSFRMYDSFSLTYQNEAVAKAFAAVLDEVRPDVVHIQHLLYLGAGVIEEAKKRKIPIVFTLHDYWLICPQGQLLKNTGEACEGKNASVCVGCILYQLNIRKNTFNVYYFFRRFACGAVLASLKSIYLHYHRLNKNRLNELIEERAACLKEALLKVSLFIAPSQFLRNKFIESGIAQGKIIFLPYGFNADKFSSPQKFPSDKLRFGFIGSLLPAKGLGILIQAFNQIKNDKVELKIYGKESGYKGVLTDYPRQIKKLAKSKNIRFMGGFDNKNIARIFLEIDVLVVPSIWPENSPLVIQEAFLSKTPVIASRAGGIPELIEDGISGLLFNPQSVIDLRQKMQYVINNPGIIEKLRLNSVAVKSIEENAKELEGIYESLILQARYSQRGTPLHEYVG